MKISSPVLEVYIVLAVICFVLVCIGLYSCYRAVHNYFETIKELKNAVHSLQNDFKEVQTFALKTDSDYKKHYERNFNDLQKQIDQFTITFHQHIKDDNQQNKDISKLIKEYSRTCQQNRNDVEVNLGDISKSYKKDKTDLEKKLRDSQNKVKELENTAKKVNIAKLLSDSVAKADSADKSLLRVIKIAEEAGYPVKDGFKKELTK